MPESGREGGRLELKLTYDFDSPTRSRLAKCTALYKQDSVKHDKIMLSLAAQFARPINDILFASK